jgi:hypothetical protein
MWRLFPKSWFGKDKTQQEQAEVAENLHAHWRTWLASAMSKVLVQTITPESAATTLASLHTKHLLTVDQALRYGTWGYDAGRSSRGNVSVVNMNSNRSEIEAYLFTAACDSSGFMREQALVTFRKFPGRLSLVAALIRCDDWVRQVRAEAETLLKYCIDAGHVEELFSLMDLLLALKERQRFSAGIWPRLIEPALKDLSNTDALLRSTRTGTAHSRLYCYALLTETRIDILQETYRHAVKDESPGIALWALKNCTEQQAHSELLSLALKHPHSAVRAEAVRQLTALYPTGSLTLLQSAIFDRAAAPRNAAAYLLRHHFQIEAVNYWRDCLDNETGKRTCYAFNALSEVATSDDVDRLMPWTKHTKGSIRATAFKALLKIKPSSATELAGIAIADSSTKVIREIVPFWISDPLLIDRSTLHNAFMAQKSDRAKVRLIDAARYLGRWASLEVLLDWYTSATPDIREAIHNELYYWKFRQAYQYAKLPPETGAIIKKQLIALKKTDRDHDWSQYDHILDFA